MSVELLPAVVAWAALGYKLTDPRRTLATPASRALLGILVWLVLSTTTFSAPVYRWIGETSGQPNLAILLAQCFGLVVIWPACNLLLFQVHDESTARRLARRRYRILPPLFVLTACLWYPARGTSIDPEYVYNMADGFFAVAFMTVHHAALAIAGVYCWRCCFTLSSTARGGLRIGLVFVAGAGLGALLMVGYDMSFFAATLVGIPTWLWGDVPVVMATALHTSTSLLAVGATMPDWGPRALEWLRKAYALHRLKPLWRDVTRAVPGFVLEGAYGALDLDRRLHRRVVEIRDAQLALRGYRPMEPPEQGVDAAAVRGREGAAWLEAATIAHAVRAKASGTAPVAAKLAVAAPTGGDDLRGEVEWLLTVARHYSTARSTRAAPSSAAGSRRAEHSPTAEQRSRQ